MWGDYLQRNILMKRRIMEEDWRIHVHYFRANYFIILQALELNKPLRPRSDPLKRA